ncbi:multifunctional CCA tRNA nucleotidyl transferase/2'3'-cyclic phosphodiesterase/2'nucleotidase/phosphatase [Ramlibacter sp. AW1]|uniref:CCA-adding enzyme n=1 Tax=Ramlibacter aurantiacus TaxID=2801330 RepID=A0A936ZV34_9BURK|nr:multifunctional CCA tRNA nucleotidyl transferase/2'3'-cyclic phosphodiesterase/2'nucleotidase/phosphatase [Ramlibacter aurantiacus]MBL0421695.1 multifunctional CCA tRNA nucleotidyl transferase/2'3'-cyclic phosphodiesterase/2'nucleotidase/phosphatase [Ramlibacter aurantiacus]
MQIYEVGGAVRDALLGLPVNDRDWVVVGATPEQMMAAGYLPVGKDFPVFLHPDTREEHALARTERKTARGYHGFAFQATPEVTLEEDLARRDLTINAIARAPDGRLIDPYHGQRDLRARVLRHVTEAFREDPVRILRLARLAARFHDFSIAPETLSLMRGMVADGEVDALVPERVWQELARGLMESRPSRMLEVLRACGAMARLLPEVDRLWGVGQAAGDDLGSRLLRRLDLSARLAAPLPVRFACLTLQAGPPRPMAERLRVPTECRDLAEVLAREQASIQDSASAGPAELVALLERCDALRKPQRFVDVLLVCECEARSLPGMQDAPYPQRPRLLAALEAARSVDTARIAARAQAAGVQGRGVGEWVHQARVDAVAARLGNGSS